MAAFEQAKQKAEKAAKKLPRSKTAQRERVYFRTLADEVRAICDRFNITLAELKKIVSYTPEDDDEN